MKKSDIQFNLPKNLIAQHPVERSKSKLFIVNRKNRVFEHRTFIDFSDYLNEGDCLVVNDSRVIPARFKGYRISTGGNLEILLVERIEKNKWKVLVDPGRKARIGDSLMLEGNFRCYVVDIDRETGERILEFDNDSGLFDYGSVPLPPYIEREPDEEDVKRYQTVYARNKGSIAAPTAGLHFSESMLDRIEDKGVKIISVTLHVGPGTFRPIRTEIIEKHNMESERYEINGKTADIVNETKDSGNNIFAVGTTTVRVLESAINEEGYLESGKGRTDLFIYPPFEFKIVDNLLTNFHLPGSTLILLVSAFAGYELTMNAYREAVSREYRFYSYGDAMLII